MTAAALTTADAGLRAPRRKPAPLPAPRRGPSPLLALVDALIDIFRRLAAAADIAEAPELRVLLRLLATGVLAEAAALEDLARWIPAPKVAA